MRHNMFTKICENRRRHFVLPVRRFIMRIRSAVSVYHQTDDLFICLPHPVFAQPADPADRGFHIFHDDPVTAFKFLIIFIHIVTENSGVHGKSDLCRAGCLCPVADDAGDNGKGR